MKMIHTLDWEKGRRKAQSPAGPVRHACMHQEPGRTDSKSWDNGDSPILPGPSSLNLTSRFQAQSFNTAVLGHPGRPLSDPFPAASLRLFSGDSNPPRIVSGKPAPKL